MKRLFKNFPSLEATGGRLTSPQTPVYNCIAWAAGDQSRWWWPNPGGYWPPSAPTSIELTSFIQAFATVGYERCADGVVEIGFEKIAIYCIDGKPTHASRQLPSGAWTSKLGRDVDIEHQAVEGLCGPAYGVVAAFMRRSRKR